MQVPTLDVMLFVREYVGTDASPDVFIGRVDVHLFAAFVDGVRFHLYCSAGPDREFTDFSRWLRDEKQEFPPGGWAKKFLAEAGGDHRAAICRFLDRCKEYADTHRPGP